ncbi:MAG: DEAD/DEAH box helicase family protein, partial [Bacteroidota bacterium]
YGIKEMLKTVLIGPKDTIKSLNSLLFLGADIRIQLPQYSERFAMAERYSRNNVLRRAIFKKLDRDYYVGGAMIMNRLEKIFPADREDLIYKGIMSHCDLPLDVKWQAEVINHFRQQGYFNHVETLGDIQGEFVELPSEHKTNLGVREIVFDIAQKRYPGMATHLINPDEIISKPLKDFILGASDQLTDKVKDALNPLYNPGSKEKNINEFTARCQQTNKIPYPAQQDTINALSLGYSKGKKALALVGEMGTGKTMMGLLTTVASNKKPKRNLIICPPSLVSTWVQEIKETLGNKANIVNANGHDSLELFINAKKNRKVKPKKHEFWVIGFNRAKLGSGWKPVFFEKRMPIDTENVSITELCDKCSHPIDPEQITFNRKMVCERCNTPLWGLDGRLRRYAPVQFIKKYLKGYFDFLVADEVHQMKGGNTIQGALLGQLASVCKKVLLLTGTLSGGKASDIFYIIQRAIALNYNKEVREKILPDFCGLTDFVSTYGTLESIYKYKDEDSYYGTKSKVKANVREQPGISPMVLRQYFIENTVFIRIADIAHALPAFKEELEFVELPDDLQAEYDNFQNEATKEAYHAMQNKDYSVLGQVLSNLLAWPDFPQKGAEIYNNTNSLVASAFKWKGSETPKDERLLEILEEAGNKNRKAIIFVEYTGKWEGDRHIADMLERNGFNPLVLKSTIPSNKRLDWINKHFNQDSKYDCLICQPRLVEVGLNLRQFPEVIFYQTGYSTFVLRQASRRSYRPGQKQDVVVRYMINKNTAQEKAMSLIASKLEAAVVLEGDLSDKGLTALSTGGGNIALELARAIVNNIDSGLEDIFEKYKKAEFDAESVLGDKNPTNVLQTTAKTTHISKGNRSQSYGVRKTVKAVLVGQLSINSTLKRGTGKLKNKKISLINDEIFLASSKKRIGEISDQGIIFDSLDGKFRYKEIPGMPGNTNLGIYQIMQ